MLVFHSHCQLGNQMFIYACSRSIAKKRKLSYCISQIGDLKYFNLTPFDYLFNSLKYAAFKIQNIFRKFKFEHFQDNRIDYSPLILSEQAKNVWYYGYFQGLNYFFENSDEIKTLFTIKKHYQKIFNEILKKVSKEKKILVVHIRLGDYRNLNYDHLKGPDLTLPFSYYHQLLNSFNLEDYQIIFTSDEIETVKKEFQGIKHAYFSKNNAIIDFQFIKNADIALISHSTFGWWAAWLNEKPGKQIYIPDYFLGFKVEIEYPVNIIPKSWNKVKVI